MRKSVLLIVMLTWVLAACAGSSQQAVETAVLPVTGTEAATAPAALPSPAETAAPPVTEDPAAPAAAGPTAAAPAASGGQSGVITYAIVPEESTVAYEVNETFLDQGNVINTAIGKTTGVTGSLQVDFDRPANTQIGPLTVDISTLASDSRRRDGAIRSRFLESAKFPTVTFTTTAIEGLPAAIEPGVDYPVTLRGDLTIRETTRPAAFDTVVRLQGDELAGQARTTFLMSDFGFGPIEMFGVLKTEDQVKITVDFVARPQ